MYYKSMVGTRQRRTFNPENKQDQQELAYFIKNKKWRSGCPFFLEFPYSDIPSMCLARYAEYKLASDNVEVL